MSGENFSDRINGHGNRLVEWSRPDSFWDVLGIHLPIVLAAGLPLLISIWVPISVLPLKACTFRAATGYPCPFCGVTRAIWAISDGNMVYAVRTCPLACALYPVMAAAGTWSTAALVFRIHLRPGPMLRTAFSHRSRMTGAIIFLFLLNWGYRLVMGLA